MKRISSLCFGRACREKRWWKNCIHRYLPWGYILELYRYCLRLFPRWISSFIHIYYEGKRKIEKNESKKKAFFYYNYKLLFCSYSLSLLHVYQVFSIFVNLWPKAYFIYSSFEHIWLHYIINVLLCFEFSTAASADWFSLEFEWQQVSSSLRELSGWS